MTTQELITFVLAKVPEDKKEAFLEDLRDKTVRKDASLLDKYGVVLTAEELDQISNNEISDADLDEAAGGCLCMCSQCFDQAI